MAIPLIYTCSAVVYKEKGWGGQRINALIKILIWSFGGNYVLLQVKGRNGRKRL